MDHVTPTGIDRVEGAYIRRLLGGEEPVWCLARIGPWQMLMDRAGTKAVLGGEGRPGLRGLLSRQPLEVKRAQGATRMRALGRVEPAGLAALLARHLPRGVTAYNVGHSNLSEPVMAGLGRAGLRRVVMIHDAIPLDHPEYARRGTSERFAGKLRAAAHAERILVNSAHTAARVRHWLGSWRLRVPETVLAPLGIGLPRREAPPPAHPYFVMLGTVEPRKGHDMLLALWRALPAGAPHLHVVGRAGWASPGLLKELASGSCAGRTIFWHQDMGDEALARLLSRARALLLPSRAEGYGLPLAEALAAGVPAIASDLPAPREVGGEVPLYLPPDDREAWRRAILAFAGEAPERQRQLSLLQSWRPFGWEDHFGIALAETP
ncbi:MAG TPA: glycosyltransferase [Paracoccaceae bacterium]|nr:glycosyltransferase [Paracoccaceae bacterium]